MLAEAALAEDHTKILATAISHRQSQLRRWLQWHAGAGANRAVNNKTVKVINDLLKPKTHAKKLWEIYSKVYYKTHIQPHIESGMAIANVTKKIRELYENESPEIKEDVRRISAEHKNVEKKQGGGRTSQSQTGDLDDSECNVDNGEGEEDLLVHRR